jgi:hypothetical protein
MRVARKLSKLYPAPKRVLVGDAGAIPYESDLPALDIIGLGGYRGLPFARSSRFGVAASLELVERMPANERPDVLALYPSWWAEFPLWFGHVIDLVDAPGNVICGAPTKAIYRPDWSSLDGTGVPLVESSEWGVIDRFDLGDVISEREHQFKLNGTGFIVMKQLGDPRAGRRWLWDAGRILRVGERATFRVANRMPDRPIRFRARFAPSQDATLRITVNDEASTTMPLRATDGWVEKEASTVLNAGARPDRITLEVEGNDVVVYHWWILQGR